MTRRLRPAAAHVLRLALRLSGRRAGIALVYHALAERLGDPRRELVPPHSLALFEAQLRHVRAHYRLVRAEQLLDAVAARKRGERFPLAITFDDDLSSHAELAAPVLLRLGVPATFFLCGASLERPFSFWWQRLQRAVDRGLAVPVEGDGIHEIARRIEEMSPGERDRVSEELGRELGGDVGDAALGSGQVALLAEAGFDIGFHTLRHDRLTGLDDDALASAMRAGRRELESATGRALGTICYPHGKADARVAAAARAAGFAVGFTGRYEPVEPTSDPLLLGRVEPTFASGSDFSLQLVRVLLGRPHR